MIKNNFLLIFYLIDYNFKNTIDKFLSREKILLNKHEWWPNKNKRREKNCRLDRERKKLRENFKQNNFLRHLFMLILQSKRWLKIFRKILLAKNCLFFCVLRYIILKSIRRIIGNKYTVCLLLIWIGNYNKSVTSFRINRIGNTRYHIFWEVYINNMSFETLSRETYFSFAKISFSLSYVTYTFSLHFTTRKLIYHQLIVK